MRSKLLLAAAFLLGGAPAAQAQISITPFAGTMIPMRSLLLDTAGTAGFRMQNQTIFGMQFAKAMSPSLGLELALGAGSGSMQIFSTDVIDLKTSVYFADLRARVRVAGNEDAQLAAVVGAGWTQYTSGLFDAAHEGDPDTQFKGTATGLLGLALKARLGAHANLSFEAIDRIHEQGVDAPGITGGLTELMQHDITIAAGLSFPLGR